jgi:nickel/cobalt transporter (NicO) family protein
MELLLFSALAIGSLHALAPDHWIPFVALARAQQWSKLKTTVSVILAGVGHVGSSVVISIIGIGVGIAAEHVNGWESMRGNIASLLLIGFGLAYMVWGIKNMGRNHHHQHTHSPRTVTYWTLFILIIFGPCEPLIPIVFASTAYGWESVIIVVSAFSIATIMIMVVQVHAALWGLSFFNSHYFEHAADAIAGGVIVITGIAIRVLGI